MGGSESRKGSWDCHRAGPSRTLGSGCSSCNSGAPPRSRQGSDLVLSSELTSWSGNYCIVATQDYFPLLEEAGHREASQSPTVRECFQKCRMKPTRSGYLLCLQLVGPCYSRVPFCISDHGVRQEHPLDDCALCALGWHLWARTIFSASVFGLACS